MKNIPSVTATTSSTVNVVVHSTFHVMLGFPMFVLGMELGDITDEFERMKSHTEYINNEGYLED